MNSSTTWPLSPDGRRFDEFVPFDEEHLEYETVEPGAEDSGEIETLPDGSLSIPVFAEEVIVTKRIVLKERVVIRKRTVTARERVKLELRREEVAIEADPGIDVKVDPPPA